MSRKASLKFPAGCEGPAEVKAAYRFLDNEHVTFLSILSPHRDATIERIREQPVVLIPQDTTELDLTRPHEIMVGAGPLNDSARVGFHDHASLAMTPERLVLGVVHAKIWARIPSRSRRMPTKSAPSGVPSRSRTRRAFAGSRDIARVNQIAQEASGTHIVSLSDSEADIYELIVEGQAVEGVRKASFIIRACQNRALVAPDETPSPESHNHLREQVASTPVLRATDASRFVGVTPSRRTIGSESNRARRVRPKWPSARRV